MYFYCLMAQSVTYPKLTIWTKEWFIILGVEVAAVHGIATLGEVYTAELADPQSQQFTDLQQRFCAVVRPLLFYWFNILFSLFWF